MKKKTNHDIIEELLKAVRAVEKKHKVSVSFNIEKIRRK